MKKTLITGLSILSCAGILSARTWTSANGSDTFDADYVSHSASEVTVIKDSKKVSFALNLLSSDDQAWISKQAQPAANANAATFVDGLNKHLTKFDGAAYQPYTPEKNPEYYVLYFSASW